MEDEVKFTEDGILHLVDLLLDFNHDRCVYKEREEVLKRLIRANGDGYIGMKELCAIFDIDLPKQTEEAQAEEQE